jgi:Ser/Thr protein kinase RdoA (MazF antagonist)
MPKPGSSIASAVAAVVHVAQSLGIESAAPVLLHASQHISIRSSPTGPVARVVLDDGTSATKLRQELRVARYLASRGAPIVEPVTGPAAGPHFFDGFAMTFWEFVAHIPPEEDNAQHIAYIAAALRRLHHHLADLPGELPNFWVKIERCRDLLQSPLALPALNADDRRFLLTTYDRLRISMERLPVRLATIHGDAHWGNVFITSDRALWNDFEDVCVGPREWDIGWLPAAEWVAFGPLDRDALVVLGYLRSFCVSVWCWDLAELPGKREAAEYHLGYLRGQVSAGQIP